MDILNVNRKIKHLPYIYSTMWLELQWKTIDVADNLAKWKEESIRNALTDEYIVSWLQDLQKEVTWSLEKDLENSDFDVEHVRSILWYARDQMKSRWFTSVIKEMWAGFVFALEAWLTVLWLYRWPLTAYYNSDVKKAVLNYQNTNTDLIGDEVAWYNTLTALLQDWAQVDKTKTLQKEYSDDYGLIWKLSKLDVEEWSFMTSGRVYNEEALVAAHPDIPLGTTIEVMDLSTRKTVQVTIVSNPPEESMGWDLLLLTEWALRELEVEWGKPRVKIRVSKGPSWEDMAPVYKKIEEDERWYWNDVSEFTTVAWSESVDKVVRDECWGAWVYDDKFHWKLTNSGEVYDKDELTIAHNTLPFGTIVEIQTVWINPKTVRARVNDRWPYVPWRIIDMSKATAEALWVVRGWNQDVNIRTVNRMETSD